MRYCRWSSHCGTHRRRARRRPAPGTTLPNLLTYSRKNMFLLWICQAIFRGFERKLTSAQFKPPGYGFSLDREPTEGRAGRPAAGRYRNISHGWLVCPGQYGIFLPSAQPSNTGRIMTTIAAMMTVYRYFTVDKKLLSHIA